MKLSDKGIPVREPFDERNSEFFETLLNWYTAIATPETSMAPYDKYMIALDA